MTGTDLAVWGIASRAIRPWRGGKIMGAEVDSRHFLTDESAHRFKETYGNCEEPEEHQARTSLGGVLSLLPAGQTE